MLRFQVCSDIHTEFYKTVRLDHFLTPSADYLILAGDVGIPIIPTYKSFLQQCNDRFKKVFIVLGNHEYYGNTLSGTFQMVQEQISDLPNVVLLHDSEYRFEEENFTLLGTILWSRVHPTEYNHVKERMADYQKIWHDDRKSNIDPSHTVQVHERHVDWLRTEIETRFARGERLGVVTHHLPSFSLISAEHKHSPINSAFASNLDLLIRPPIEFWVSGHSHSFNRRTINGVRCIVNPSGYPNEATRVQRKLVVEATSTTGPFIGQCGRPHYCGTHWDCLNETGTRCMVNCHVNRGETE